MARSIGILSLLAAMLLAASASQCASARDNDGFVPLFNGKDLDAWVKRGGKATYHIDGDEIVGTSVLNTDNTFLCTPRDYADFELQLEFKVDDGLNSGIQIRSQAFDEVKEVELQDAEGNTTKKKIPAGRVHGYQVEIDTNPNRSWSGGIYDEARRGWLNNLDGEKNKPAREAFKHEEWNKYRIRAVGDSIRTWVNGIPAADLTDDMTPAGFIGLQVHGIGNNKDLEGTQVRWRNSDDQGNRKLTDCVIADAQ